MQFRKNQNSGNNLAILKQRKLSPTDLFKIFDIRQMLGPYLLSKKSNRYHGRIFGIHIVSCFICLISHCP